MPVSYSFINLISLIFFFIIITTYVYIILKYNYIIICNIIALDAYCLLEIYATLEIQCEHLEIPFDDACLELQHIPFKSSSQKNIRRLAQKVNFSMSQIIL